jgi:hypothetical protein
MKFKLDKSVPSDVKFGTTHLSIEFDDPSEFDQAKQYIDGWFEQELGKLSPEVLAIMKDHSPRKFGGGGGGGGFKKKQDAAPPAPGEYNNLVERAAKACGHNPSQQWHSMIWGYVGAYEKNGVWKGPFDNGYDAGAQGAKDKGWDWWPGKQVEKLLAVVKALECGDAVPIRYAAGNKGKDAGWETIWKEATLTPQIGGAPPEAAGMTQTPPDPFDSATATALPDVPAFPSVGDFSGTNPDPAPPAGFGAGSHNVPF